MRLGQNHQESTREQIIELSRAIDTFRWDNNRYPVTLKELTSRPENIGRDVWRGPYSAAGTKDSWGNEIAYAMPGTGDHGYDVTSWGEDGKQGGSEFAADLSNHD